MLFLIPLGHELTTFRRAPWVTIAIAVLCLGMQARACSAEPAVITELSRITDQIEATEEQLMMLGSSTGSVLRQAGYAALADEVETGEPAEAVEEVGTERAELTARLEALKRERDVVMEQLPSMQYGYRPARDGVLAMLTSAFAHAGWPHLLGNMLFLYVVGCNMEDRWGRGAFAGFYLVGAIVAAVAFKLSQPHGMVPLVGASGAVAAAMGAFVVCYGRATIRFFYAYWILLRPRWGTFNAPAWIALLMWFAQQLLMAWLDESGGDGVAYAAHVGGFAYGLAVAFVLKATGYDTQLDAASDAAADTGEEWTETPAAQVLLRAIDERQPEHIRQHATDAFVGWNRTGEAARIVATYRSIREQYWELELGEPTLRAVITAATHKGTDPLVCVDVASQLIRQHPQSGLVPRAMWIAAQGQESLQRHDLARRTLQNLIAAFPMEPLSEQARRKVGMRSIRPPES